MFWFYCLVFDVSVAFIDSWLVSFCVLLIVAVFFAVLCWFCLGDCAGCFCVVYCLY